MFNNIKEFKKEFENKLINKINEEKERLYKIIETKNLIDLAVIKQSEQVDKYLNILNKLRK